jgi:hypothetical protein
MSLLTAMVTPPVLAWLLKRSGSGDAMDADSVPPAQ